MSAESYPTAQHESVFSAGRPTVSIILPVLNEEAQLERCLRAVASRATRDHRRW